MAPAQHTEDRTGEPPTNAGNLGKVTEFALILGFLAHKINVLNSFLAPRHLPFSSTPHPLELLMEIFELYMKSQKVMQESFFFLSIQKLTETFAFQVF